MSADEAATAADEHDADAAAEAKVSDGGRRSRLRAALGNTDDGDVASGEASLESLSSVLGDRGVVAR